MFKLLQIASLAAALLFPVIFFSTTLVHEQAPILPFFVCPAGMLAAVTLGVGLSTSEIKEYVFGGKDGEEAKYGKFVFWAGIIGLVEAALIVLT